MVNPLEAPPGATKQWAISNKRRANDIGGDGLGAAAAITPDGKGPQAPLGDFGSLPRSFFPVEKSAVLADCEKRWWEVVEEAYLMVQTINMLITDGKGAHTSGIGTGMAPD